MKILLLSRYGRLGASSRIRSYQYLPYLREKGVHVTIAPFFDDDYLIYRYSGSHKILGAIFRAYVQRIFTLFKTNSFDLIWIEKEVLPWLPAWGEGILSLLKVPYIVDYDDAIFHRYDMDHRGVVRSLLGKKIDEVMRKAALVIVGNQYLANRAIKAGAKLVEYLPTVVDSKRYRVKSIYDKSKIKIGWIGSPTTAKYLHLVQPALMMICKEGNTRLVLIGAGQIELKGVPTETRSWSEESECDEINDFDIGIMPIPDDPWARGKCGYKLIQYMASGLPVVASGVTANLGIIEHGVSGYIAKTLTDWVDALVALRDDFRLRKRMGNSGRIKVEKNFDLQISAPRLLSFISSVVKESN